MTEQVMTQKARLDRAIANSPPALDDVDGGAKEIADPRMGMLKGDELVDATFPLDRMLNKRAKTHGDYGVHASITQALKFEMKHTHGWLRLDHAQKEALEMIAHKIGRILAGNPDYADHWDDIAGYARLVADRVRVFDGSLSGSSATRLCQCKKS